MFQSPKELELKKMIREENFEQVLNIILNLNFNISLVLSTHYMPQQEKYVHLLRYPFSITKHLFSSLSL